MICSYHFYQSMWDRQEHHENGHRSSEILDPGFGDPSWISGSDLIFPKWARHTPQMLRRDSVKIACSPCQRCTTITLFRIGSELPQICCYIRGKSKKIQLKSVTLACKDISPVSMTLLNPNFSRIRITYAIEAHVMWNPTERVSGKLGQCWSSNVVTPWSKWHAVFSLWLVISRHFCFC